MTKLGRGKILSSTDDRRTGLPTDSEITWVIRFL